MNFRLFFTCEFKKIFTNRLYVLPCIVTETAIIAESEFDALNDFLYCGVLIFHTFIMAAGFGTCKLFGRQSPLRFAVLVVLVDNSNWVSQGLPRGFYE